MNSLQARNHALENHPLYQEVLAEIKNAIESKPPQFRCRIDVQNQSTDAVMAVITKLRSEFYSAVVVNQELFVEWSK
jgi:hypothetical protein